MIFAANPTKQTIKDYVFIGMEKKIVKVVGCLLFICLAASVEAQNIKWMSFQEAVAASEQEPRKIIIDVYTSWCGWCKRMDATTFSNTTIADYINDNYYAVKMDGEYKKDIEFKGRVFKFVESGRRGYHELPAEMMNGKLSYPTIVYLDEEFNLIQAIPGYQAPQALEPIINYFGEDAYKQVAWDEYSANFKSLLGK